MGIFKRSKSKIVKFWKNLGPGLITGASDDDPSGIATYSQAGAKFGYSLLWTAVVTYPLIISIQEMCARLGLVTDRGLMGNIKKYYPKWVVYLILFVCFPSIILNIGADIAGMGAVGNLLFPKVPAFIFSILFTVILMYTIVQWNYRKIATVLKYLCVSLFCYIIIPFLTTTGWTTVLKETIIPDFKWNSDYLLSFVGILGTTISPYLFFWQASMEVEEENEKSIVVDKQILADMKSDVKGGLLLTNLVFYFIVLTTGTVLFSAGIRQIDTVEDAAKALQPLAGDASYALFAIGVLGTGFLAIPVLGGSLSYMLAETFDWEEGMNKKFHEAKGFYITLIVSLIVGLFILFTGISPVQALIYTAVLYGIVAPLLIAIILHICNNKKIMGEFSNKPWSNISGVITFLLMSFAAIALIWLYFKQ
ncbi:MAG TPA: Nramp family divalent metal transporter [Panacibacter sp.]|nr:Nramp family divalent metal transporter [Panacibacter sp.]HNP43301.1 Nramp family divalent metal transporter [Panacibacter sp.]